MCGGVTQASLAPPGLHSAWAKLSQPSGPPANSVIPSVMFVRPMQLKIVFANGPEGCNNLAQAERNPGGAAKPG